MWSDTDFFIGFVLPILLMGVAIGFVLFVGIPWVLEAIDCFVRAALDAPKAA